MEKREAWGNFSILWSEKLQGSGEGSGGDNSNVNIWQIKMKVRPKALNSSLKIYLVKFYF